MCNSFDHRNVEKEITIPQPCRKALSLYHRTSTLERPSKVSNMCSKGNKQEEFEDCVQPQGYQLWDSSHNWSAVMKGYRLLRKDSKKVRKGLAPSPFFL